MLLVLMYHRINDPINNTNIKDFKHHLQILSNEFPIIAPGDPLIKNTTNICLTFNDAYFDFYNDALPLLENNKIPATLGVPVKFILETTTISKESRIKVPYPQGLSGETYKTKVPLCTWQELQQIAKTDLINFASHSYSHLHLGKENFDFETEIITSKTILEEKLKTEVNSFIYPFGNTNKKIQKLVSKHYQYCFRIGSAANYSWRSLMYRIDAENYWKKSRVFSHKDLQKFQLKYWINRIRGK